MAKGAKPLSDVAQILIWQYEQQASDIKTAERWGVSRNSIRGWKKKYTIDYLKSQVNVTIDVLSKEKIVETKYPQEVINKADKILRNMTNINDKVVTIILQYLEKFETQDWRAKTDKDWSRFLRILQITAPYVLPRKVEMKGDEEENTPEQQYNSIVSKLLSGSHKSSKLSN